MLKITRRNSFEAAHYLPRTPDGHKCKGLHGHSYECVVEIRGEVDEAGWIVDTANIDNAFASVHALVDHKVLNEVPGLDNPTTERLVVWLWRRFNKTFGDLANVHSIGITVQESPRSTAFYDGP